jgi:hypothetical protein
MAATTISVRPTNGVSFGLDYTVTAQDVIDRSILFDFGVEYPLTPIVSIKDSTGAAKALTGLQITSHPTSGAILLDEAITEAVAEVSTITAILNDVISSEAEVTTVGCLANTSGSLNGKYFTISSPTVDYYVWYSTDGTGVDPSVADHTGINVDLPAGDSTDAEVASATEVVLDAYSGSAVFSSTATLADLEITNLVEGDATDATAGDSGFSITIDNQGVDANAGTLNGKYFLISSPTVNYYVWLSTDGTGVDPEVATRTGINVDLPAGDSTADEVAEAIQAVLDAHAAFSATVDTDTVTVTNAVAGAATNVGAGDSGFTVEVDTAGADEVDGSTFDFVEDDVISIIAQRTY